MAARQKTCWLWLVWATRLGSCNAACLHSPERLSSRLSSSAVPPEPRRPAGARAQALVAETMAACADPLVKKQLAYLLGRQGVVRPRRGAGAVRAAARNACSFLLHVRALLRLLGGGGGGGGEEEQDKIFVMKGDAG